MAFSAFDIIGPVMIGPSSSHTAGAARLGRVARALLLQPPKFVKITLHGSFAATGKGHGTDRALISGILGFSPDDERLPDALEIAEEQHLEIEWTESDFGEEAHPNTARIELRSSSGESHQMTGSSTGGGAIRITEIDSFPVGFDTSLDTLLLWHEDQRGFLAQVTSLLSAVNVNIAGIRTTRHQRQSSALTMVELDETPPQELLEFLHLLHGLREHRYLSSRLLHG